jgi:O-antigen ligase
MGFVLSVLYFVTYYLTPPVIFGPLAAYRIELILAGLVLLASLPKLSGSLIWKTPQSLALVGLALAVCMSVVIGMHWLGGGMPAILAFIPNALAYFLVCLHCDSKKKLQVLVLMMSFVCLFVIVQGSLQLRGVPETGSVLEGDSDDLQPVVMDDYPYLLSMTNGSGEYIYRLRGLGQINDPNDFAQMIVCILPLMFIFWSPGKALQNVLLVLLPVSALLYGVFLTHSRGALLALLAMVIVAARRRIGTVPSLVLAGGLFVAASALHFTGGRGISADAGADRTTLWGEGLQLFKSHPLFGAGLDSMADYTDTHHTAHNSLVVCAAELGLFGLYFWTMFLFPTVRDVLVIASPSKVSEGEPVISEKERFPLAFRRIEVVNKAEICRLGQLLLLSLTGFLVAGWFLSRAFIMTFFLLGGIAEVVFGMALRQGMVSPRLPLARVLGYTGGFAISLLMLMYIMLRAVNLMH